MKEKLEDFKPEYKVTDTGTVIYSGDGIILIDGLTTARYDELLEIEGGINAIAFNLEEKHVGAVVLAGEDEVKVGSKVFATGRIVRVPVGDSLLGRVVSPLGKPIDGLGELKTAKNRPIEFAAPSIIDRAKVDKPLQTGIMAIDSMIPIGRGQRELIIGDRQTGKTALAIDTILNQKGKNVYCVYVAIGQKASTVANVLSTLKEYGALEYTSIVCSTAKDSAPLQYIAPYTGCAIAEEFMYAGKDALIVYDDLSKHAVAYRAMSLLLKRPPGREAYPGDIFYLHSRLLERAAKLSDALGGGSMTALPIVETLSSDISAYIPTNVISITDGQIYLEGELFHSGVRPAVNVGLSVSRVGGSAQTKAIRSVSGKIRLDLAQYRELAVFSQFGSDLDEETQRILAYGAQVTEALKQSQYHPYTVAEMSVILYALIHNLLIKIPIKEIREFKKHFRGYLQTHNHVMMEAIEKSGNLTEENEKEITAACAEFVSFYLGQAAKQTEAK